MEKPKLLIVEDDEDIQLSMKWALGSEYALHFATDRQSALNVFKSEHPAMITLDLGLPPHARSTEEGFLTLSDLLHEDPLAKVIIVTGQDEKENAIKAVGNGAFDFFCKPVQVEEIKVILRRALRVHQLENEHRELQSKIAGKVFDEIIGTSPQMQEVFGSIEKVAGTEVPVLILGESGTGKELVARAIHRRSARKDGPFIAINCAAIPENLLESELFGHEKGAFTGAHAMRKGRVEMAQDGTLFLDEIGDLPLPLQSKLLRFLQEHSIERIGGRRDIPVDTRVLAATNRNLLQAMHENRFREDLYYRLAVVSIQLPALREREGDVMLLATSFLQNYAAEMKKKIAGFSPDALRLIESYDWPGNVREIENRVKRAVIMAQRSRISPEDMQLESREAPREAVSLKEAREKVERELILQSLSRNNLNLTRTAADLGISRPTLYELMDKLGIERK
ncbi:MAG: PEP-CTERM-box response regulator transcription factor [Syntrophobacteraceae bacterium]